MYVLVDTAINPPTIALCEQENFGELSVRVAGGADLDDLGRALVGHGRLDGESHVYLDVDALRTMAGATALQEVWQTSLEKMVSFARSKGWVDRHGAVRAHIEYREPPAARTGIGHQ